MRPLSGNFWSEYLLALYVAWTKTATTARRSRDKMLRESSGRVERKAAHRRLALGCRDVAWGDALSERGVSGPFSSVALMVDVAVFDMMMMYLKIGSNIIRSLND